MLTLNEALKIAGLSQVEEGKRAPDYSNMSTDELKDELMDAVNKVNATIKQLQQRLDSDSHRGIHNLVQQLAKQVSAMPEISKEIPKG